MNEMTNSDLARELSARRKTREKVCLRCSASFTTRGRGIYCSSRCRAAAWARQNREQKRSAKG